MKPNPLIDRLFALLGPPEKSTDVALFTAEYRKLLDRFTTGVLEKAADHLIRNLGRQWPTVKACVDACNDVQEADAVPSTEAENAKLPWVIKLKEAKVWARDYCERTSLGRQAKAEGWGDHLFHYATSYARNCPPGHKLMPMTDWRPPQDAIDCYRGYRERRKP